MKQRFIMNEKMTDIYESKLYGIVTELEVLKTATEKDMQHISQNIEDIKNEIWELKANAKKINESSVDIATLIQKSKNTTELLHSFKNELEAKMVTKEYLEEKKYKDWRLWLVVIGLVASIGFNIFNFYKLNENHKERTDVSSSRQK